MTPGVFVGAIVGTAVGLGPCCVLCVTTTGGGTFFIGIALTVAVGVGKDVVVDVGEGVMPGVGVLVGVGVGVGVLVGVGVGVGVLVGVGVGVGVLVGVGVGVLVGLDLGVGVLEDRLQINGNIVVEWLLTASAVAPRFIVGVTTGLPTNDKSSTKSESPPMKIL